LFENDVTLHRILCNKIIIKGMAKMIFKKLKKGVTSLLAAGVITSVFTVAAMAASESLNGGGATWYGGENADGILYSQLRDNASDGVVYSVTVWVKDDKGGLSEKSGTTTGVGTAGQVSVTRGATHANPFVAEKCGYKNFVVKSAY
jgi:hypothetical protein